MAWRCWMGLAETSTIAASPRASMCVSFFTERFSRGSDGLWPGFFDSILPFLDDDSHLFGGVEFWFYMLECVPRQHAQEIGSNQDLAVAIRACADADGWYRNTPAEFSSDSSGHQFQHDGKCACLDQRISV